MGNIYVLLFGLIVSTALLTMICMLLIWYNGTIDVSIDDDGDDVRLNINEYEMFRKRRFMIFIVNKTRK